MKKMGKLKLLHMINALILVFTLVFFVSKSYDTKAATPSSWAKTDVDRGISLGLVPNLLQTRYTDSITRGEFCAIAVNVYETATGKVITTRRNFDDTSDGNVQKMGGLRIVNGSGSNNFSPNDLLTREQAATILSKLSDSMGIQLTNNPVEFSDNNDISDWAFDSICCMNDLGVMRGIGDNRFDPKGAYTIEQSIISSLRVYDLGISLKLVEITEIVDESVPLAKFPVSDEVSSELQQYADETIGFINTERTNVGVPTLFVSEILTVAANARVLELEYLYSHDRPDGRQFSTVFSDLGITYGLKGENLGKGYKNSEDCVKGWMDSELHKENLLNEKFNKLGVGVNKDSEGTLYWTLLLAD